VEVEARIRKVLDSTTTPSPGTVPDHLRRGVTSVRVSTFMILSFHCPCDLAQGLGCGGSEPWGADPPMDASRWEARHASNGVTWVCEERERAREIGVPPIRQQGNRGRRSLLDPHPPARGR
jgi:hypothetical protein